MRWIPDPRYPARSSMPETNGHLVFVKSHLPAQAPVDVLAYAATSKTFPHETTGNQSFTESQLESYRRLGRFIAGG